MAAFVFKRLAMALPVMLAVATIVFFLIHAIPGDPVDLILGEQALSVEPHLARFVSGLARGDWGRSLFDRAPVLSHIGRHAGATLLLAASAMFVAVLIAIPAGVFAAVRKGSLWDQAAMLAALVGAGAVDGVTRLGEPTVDGFGAHVHRDVVVSLRRIVEGAAPTN